MQSPPETSESESPAWHDDVLRETEQRNEAGLERPVDWATAKLELGKSKPRLKRGSYADPLGYPTHGEDPFGRDDA